MRPTVQDVPVILLAIVMVLLSGMAFVTITHEAHHHFSAASGTRFTQAHGVQSLLADGGVAVPVRRALMRT